MESKDFRSLLAAVLPGLQCEHCLGGSRASDANNQMIIQFYSAWCYLVCDVLDQSNVDNNSVAQRLASFCQALHDCDVVDVLTFCQDASDALIRNRITSYGGFKVHLYELHPELKEYIGRLLAPINPLLVSLFECPDVKADCLRPVLSFLRYGKKLQFESIGLEGKALTTYLETEDRLATVCIDSSSDLIRGLNCIMRRWLRDLDLSDLIPVHGGGSVAEGPLTVYEKYHRLTDDAMLRMVLGPNWASYFPFGSSGTLERTSRTIFVPKTFAKLRTISMEPTSLQYFQQGVMEKVYSYIGNHRYLGGRIKLRDQSQNQKLAMQGSVDNSLSTIDLSAASDSVSWALVKGVFRGTPLMKWLWATRSRSTLLPNGNTVRLRKFAPMGSALCFPVECLIFAAVLEYAVHKECRTFRGDNLFWSVFGDDLVVPKQVTENVINLLNEIGFLVNVDKSFTDGPFRESCGKDYYEGIDVSSIYYRLPAYDSRTLSPDVYAAICSGANLAFERGLPRLRQHYIELLLRNKRTSPYFTSEENKSPAVYSPTPTNYHVVRRYKKGIQLWIGKFCTVKSKRVVRDEIDNEETRYYYQLALMARSKKTVLSPLDDVSPGVTLHGAHTYLGYVEYEVDQDCNPG